MQALKAEKKVLSERSESKDKMWYLYILKCNDSSLYIGATDNLERRFQEHLSGRGGFYTKSHSPTKILYTESFQSQTEAFKREKQIKGWTRAKKLALIENNLDLLKKL